MSVGTTSSPYPSLGPDGGNKIGDILAVFAKIYEEDNVYFKWPKSSFSHVQLLPPIVCRSMHAGVETGKHKLGSLGSSHLTHVTLSVLIKPSNGKSSLCLWLCVCASWYLSKTSAEKATNVGKVSP